MRYGKNIRKNNTEKDTEKYLDLDYCVIQELGTKCDFNKVAWQFIWVQPFKTQDEDVKTLMTITTFFFREQL